MKLAEKNGVRIFLQSSTAAVYGDSKDGFVSESNRLEPISPYGESKAQAEEFLNALIKSERINGASLRYFNVVGSLKESLKDTSKSNLFPKVIQALELGEPPIIFGDDYPTKDGTCIRDYVHVEDIARAHIMAGTKLSESQTSFAINLGTGTGFSVREIMNEIIRQKDSSLLPIISDRRIGDPAILVAKVGLAENELGFVTKKSLQDMVSSSI
jgi:UDP-glucose 4-epimerase